MRAPIDTKEEFSFLKRAKSFANAGKGVVVFFKTTPNAWIQLFIFVVVLALGYYFHITSTEWMFLILSAGFVFVAEAFNTAIEIDIDLTSPEFHPYARDTKDVAAGAVLIAASTALIIGVAVFGKYILAIFA
jgi:diacylglycerol kinase (ATP)